MPVNVCRLKKNTLKLHLYFQGGKKVNEYVTQMFNLYTYVMHAIKARNKCPDADITKALDPIAMTKPGGEGSAGG